MKTFVLLLIVLCSLATYAAECPNLMLHPSASSSARVPDAEALLAAAVDKAKAENKLVLLRFSEVWCGSCTRLQGILDRANVKAIFGAEFIDLKIDNTKTPKGRQLYLKYAKNGDGVPWFAFLDGKNVLATSVGPSGNVGCPMTHDEITYFVSILKQHTKMTPAQLAEVEAEFSKP